MATAPDNRMSLRRMEPGDLAAAHLLSKAEKWPHRLEDWQMMLRLGEGIVAEVAGEVMATAMWFPTGRDTATIGMVIVSSNFRGGGIGRLVLKAALERAGCATFELNATQVAVPLYRKLGFQGISEILQHQGAAFHVPVAALEPGERLRPIGLSDHAHVKAMVEDATGLQRDAAMRWLLEDASAVALDRDGALAGVAFFRRFGRGYVIGPVIAPALAQAKALISHWLGSRAGAFARIDIPAECGLGPWLDELGLAQATNVVTMVRGRPLPASTGNGRSFAILSQALG